MPIKKAILSTGAGERRLAEVRVPLDLDALAAGEGPGDGPGEGPGKGPWEVEIGFGKGRYLLQRARAEPETRFLGIEIASKYYRILAKRARRRGLGNLVAVLGDAPYLMSAVLPRGFARAVHVYFPDPWPKTRHHKRRLFDPENLDLLFGLLHPEGRLWFATDFLDYGALVVEMLERMPGLEIERLPGLWPEGPRTNYEAKYIEEGRPILRLGVRRKPGADGTEAPATLHPEGAAGILCAWARYEDPALSDSIEPA